MHFFFFQNFQINKCAKIQKLMASRLEWQIIRFEKLTSCRSSFFFFLSLRILIRSGLAEEAWYTPARSPYLTVTSESITQFEFHILDIPTNAIFAKCHVTLSQKVCRTEKSPKLMVSLSYGLPYLIQCRMVGRGCSEFS